MAGDDVRAVKVYRKLVQDLLDKSAQVKRDSRIEPPLTDADLGDAIHQIQQGQDGVLKEQGQQAQYAVVETAFRQKFYNLLVSLRTQHCRNLDANPESLKSTTSIDDPSFIQIWNLLDIVSIFSDNGNSYYSMNSWRAYLTSRLEQCEPGLIFWLIEELLDSQTIDGCRKVFDYLESRRERNTAVSELRFY